MENQEELRKLLGEELEKIRQRNPRYSQRALALSLGLSSGELNEILNGKRSVSKRKTAEILKRLKK